jgi:hypothetical protein
VSIYLLLICVLICIMDLLDGGGTKPWRHLFERAVALEWLGAVLSPQHLQPFTVHAINDFLLCEFIPSQSLESCFIGSCLDDLLQ